jgi:hypothetical protein
VIEGNSGLLSPALISTLQQRARDDDTNTLTPGVISACIPKESETRLGPWEGPPNEARKCDEQAENVKTDEQAMKLFEHVTKFIDENPESNQSIARHSLLYNSSCYVSIV